MQDASPKRQNFLIVGPAGSGKTSLFATIPGKKFVYVFDPNAVRTLEGLDIEYEEFLADELDLSIITMKGGTRDTATKTFNPETYQRFKEDFEQRVDDHFFDDFAAVAFDGLTGLEAIAMDRMQFLNGRFGKVPEMTDNVATREVMSKVIRMVTNLPCITYLHCHVDYDKDETTGKMMNQMAVIGKLKRQLPMNCSEIWQAYSEPDDKDNPRFYVQTVSDRYSPWIRTSRRLSFVDSHVEVTIGDWTKADEYGLGPILREAHQA